MQTIMRDDMIEARAGLIETNIYSITRINNSKQTEQYTVTDIDLETTVTINGQAATVNVGDGARTKAQLVGDLIAEINDNLGEPVLAILDPDNTDKFFVESNVSGTAFTVGALVNATSTTLIANEVSIKFGRLVTQDIQPGNIGRGHLPSLEAEITSDPRALGFAGVDLSLESAQDESQNLGYAPKNAVRILRKGRIWVEVEDIANVAIGGAVFVRHTATAPEERGAVRSDADGTDADQLPGDTYFTGDVRGDLALVNYRM